MFCTDEDRNRFLSLEIGVVHPRIPISLPDKNNSSILQGISNAGHFFALPELYSLGCHAVSDLVNGSTKVSAVIREASDGDGVS